MGAGDHAPIALVLDLVEWIAREPRTHADVMAVWRTSCPRLPVWEDALEQGLVARDVASRRVVVTPEGRAFLVAHGRHGSP
jgi:hypothetical protein